MLKNKDKDKKKGKDKEKKEKAPKKDKIEKLSKKEAKRDKAHKRASSDASGSSGKQVKFAPPNISSVTQSSPPMLTPSALAPKGLNSSRLSSSTPRLSPTSARPSTCAPDIPPPKIFGVGGATFEELLKYERMKHPELHIEVPLVISRCLDFLMYKGLNAEGLFRVPGAKDTLDYYISEFNAGRGDAINFLKKDELPENVASLLKQYLREMPDIPLFTKGLEEEFSSIPSLPSDEDRVARYRELLQQVPPVNQLVIKKLLFYLMQVSSNASTNKMSTDALSIVFGQMAGVFARSAYELVKWLIEKYPIVYENAELAVADSPVFLRKLVGHFRSVITLCKEGDHVISVDTTGNVRIWDAVNFQYLRSFDTSIKYCKKPVILNSKIYFIDQPSKSLKVWNIEDCINVNCDPTPTEIKLDMDLASVLIPVGNQIWVGGEKIIKLSEDGTSKALCDPDPRAIYNSLTVVGNKVWGLKGKNVHIFDIETETLEHDIAGKFKMGNPQDVLPLENGVWISGRIAAKGAIWVMDTQTFEIIGELEKHNSEVYMCQDIGPLIWSVSWDKMIYTWRPEDRQFVSPIHNFHTDAIQAILSVPRPQGDGWIVWTASSDSTINVLFVPSNYADALTTKAKLATLTPRTRARSLGDLSRSTEDRTEDASTDSREVTSSESGRYSTPRKILMRTNTAPEDHSPEEKELPVVEEEKEPAQSTDVNEPNPVETPEETPEENPEEPLEPEANPEVVIQSPRHKGSKDQSSDSQSEGASNEGLKKELSGDLKDELAGNINEEPVEARDDNQTPIEQTPYPYKDHEDAVAAEMKRITDELAGQLEEVAPHLTELEVVDAQADL